jgi:chromosome segregation ATPase
MIMENVTKLTESEILQIKELQEQQDSLITSFGQLEYQIQLLEIQKKKLVEDLEKLRKKEKDIAQELTQKYGNGTINIEEGTFTKN